jgi:hypothetical protein
VLPPLPEITSESEEGYYDLVFSIRKHENLPDGSRLIRASGLHHGTSVGIDVALGPEWKQRSMGPVVVYLGTVTYRSIGAESDSFLATLDHLYGTKLSPRTMRQETAFSAITLEGDPRELAKGPIKAKLFYEPGGGNSDDRYAEFFTNIDLKAGALQIREKDEEYRTAIIRALQQP